MSSPYSLTSPPRKDVNSLQIITVFELDLGKLGVFHQLAVELNYDPVENKTLLVHQSFDGHAFPKRMFPVVYLNHDDSTRNSLFPQARSVPADPCRLISKALLWECRYWSSPGVCKPRQPAARTGISCRPG